MGGARLDSGSPSSSDDESVVGSGGGAPLWVSSPGRSDSGSEGGDDSPSRNRSATSLETGDSRRPRAKSALAGEEDPRTPSDQGIETPEPLKPRRSLSKSAVKAATRALLSQVGSSGGGMPPIGNLSSYPGPGTVHQRPPSHPFLVSVAPGMGGIPVSVSTSTSQAQGRPSLRGAATSHSFLDAMQAMNLHAEEENIHPAQKIHRDETYRLQTRVWGLRQGLYQQSSVPQEFRTSFDYDVQELVNNMRKMNQAIDTLAVQLKQALSDQDRIRGLEATIRDLEGDLRDWKERSQNAEKTLANISGRSDEDMRTIQFLKEQLRQNEMARTILQDQVNGKRNLWLNIHGDPQERAAVLDSLARASPTLSGQTFAAPPDQAYSARAPESVLSGSSYTSGGSYHSAPLAAGSLHSGSGRSLVVAQGNAINPGSFSNRRGPYQGGGHSAGAYSPFQPVGALIPHSHSGPAVCSGQHQRRLSNATATSSHSGAGYATSNHSGGGPSRPGTGTGPRRQPPRVSTIAETGSPVERKRNVTRSLVRANLQDHESLEWAEQFQSIFALIYGFCASYFHELPRIDTDWKSHIEAEANGDLLEYICRICHHGHEQERGDYALQLLKNRDSRPHLMQRLILQHIMVFICSYEGWKEYSEDIDEEMEELAESLKTIDPSKTHDRQEVIDRRAEIVTEIIESENAAAFKNFKLTQHHQYLKTMVAPFLAKRQQSNVTNEAFYDLYAITTQAWDMSAKLFRSRLTFQFVWNDVGARFAAETHEPLDCIVDRRTLQNEHIRVRLCTTPAVTMRNDQGMTIDTKHILKAGVLVMKY